MLNTTQNYFNDLLEKYPDKPQKIVDDILSRFSDIVNPNDDMTGVFSLCRKMGIRLVTIDYKDDISQFVKRGKNLKSYIFLDATSDYRKLRFNAATLLYCAMHSKKTGKEIVTKSHENQNLHRAKRFAAYLLMPTKTLKNVLYEKDEKGDYKFLVNYNNQLVIPFKNIHYIAERFGVEFATCAKRILHSGLVQIRNINNIDELKKRLKGPQASEATRRELIPDWESHDYKLKCCLINNMHFPNIDTANEVVKEKLRVESIKNDCVIEGVVSTAKGMDKFLAKYRVNPESVKEEMKNFSPAQRIMLGHYDAIKALGTQPFSKFFVNDLHAEIFKYAVIISDEGAPLEFEKFGNFRSVSNRISGADFDTDHPSMIYSSMTNLYYDVNELIENMDKYSNVEYINRVNHLAHKFLVSHPFEDGNGRVSRLLQNFLFISKGLPPFFVNASKRKDEYINALKDLSDCVRWQTLENIDYSKLNSVVIDCIVEAEGIFYSAKAMIEDPNKAIDDAKHKKK